MDRQCDRCRFKELSDHPGDWCYMFKNKIANCAQQELTCEDWLSTLRAAMDEVSTISVDMEELAKAFDRTGNEVIYMEIDQISLRLAKIRNDIWNATAAANRELG